MWTVFNFTKQDGSREMGIMYRKGNKVISRKVMLRLPEGKKPSTQDLARMADEAATENAKLSKKAEQKKLKSSD